MGGELRSLTVSYVARDWDDYPHGDTTPREVKLEELADVIQKACDAWFQDEGGHTAVYHPPMVF